MDKYRHGRNRIMVGIIFLLFCCVLSHLVIPHHCHHSTFCVTIGGIHSTDDTSGNGEHAPFSHDDGCILEKVVLRNSNQQQHIQEIPPIILPNVYLYCNIHCFRIQEKIEILSYFKYKPYPELYFISYVVPALGLRAPPLV